MNEEFNEKTLFFLGENNLEQNNVLSANPQIAEELNKSFTCWAKNLVKPLWPPLVYFVYEENGVVYHFDN